MWGATARFFKAGALCAFLLPWVTLSCAGNEIATLSGLDLARGHATVTSPIDGGVQTYQGDPVIFALAAALIIAAALLASIFLRRRVAAAALLACALAASGLAIATIQTIENEIAARSSEGQTAQPDPEWNWRGAVWASVEATPAWGYWTCLALLGASVIASALALARAPGLRIVSDRGDV